ncbi:MAG: antitoxin VapB family protein [Candidatus Thermoplasmatota archaeon]|nr:antitoxin VapB family protein [Candidatus Thermoplasmatota archaeon]MDA8143067.1 antitoxin VapB family protein [Thermoplasmatales archaeon]
MIDDKVYEKLRSLKGQRSFSKLLDSLVEESRARKKALLGKEFGTLTNGEAAEFENAIEEFRRNFRLRT